MKKEEARELLKKYRLGLCTEREIEIINHWYYTLENDETEIDFTEKAKLIDIRHEMLEEITFKIDQSEQNISQSEPEKPVRQIYFSDMRYMRRVAAILIVGVGLAAFFFIRQNKVSNTPETILAKEIAPTAKFPSAIYLSDGSVVWLKGESRLNYPKTFTGNTREVTLKGEAFFEVAKDQERPFIIHSANLTTRVLGTSFNIKDYENEQSMEVAVVTGKVAVSIKKPATEKLSEIILTPNQKATYSRKKNFVVQIEVNNLKIYQSLAKSKLVFNEVPLVDILILLNATYDVKITLADERMKNCIITADLTGEPLMVSLKILSKAIGAEYEINGKDVKLAGPGCGLSH